MKSVRSIRFPDWVDNALYQLAKKNERSFSREVVRLVKAALKSEGIDDEQK